MQYFFTVFFLFFLLLTRTQAECFPDVIRASTPDDQLYDIGNGTIVDIKTGLMWKKCEEGRSGNNCSIGPYSTDFTWQEALQQPEVVNSAGGFAGYQDWRLPNIKELRSIVEEQCEYPAINQNRFPLGAYSGTWSATSASNNTLQAWAVYFGSGYSTMHNLTRSSRVRLVRDIN